MGSNRREQGCVAIDFDSSTNEPLTCTITIGEEILLTPNPPSANALVLILDRLLAGIGLASGKSSVLNLTEVNEVLTQAAQQDWFEWSRIDAICSKSGEWKIWFSAGPISVYLSLDKAKEMVRDFYSLVGPLAQQRCLEGSLVKRMGKADAHTNNFD